MLYFGQNVGEPGDGDMGFGDETRTSIFDYCGVPAHQRWMNNGKFDGGQSTSTEKELNNFYKTLLSFSVKSAALMGEYKEIHSYNRMKTEDYTDKIFSFVRWSENEKLIIVSNFDESHHKFQLKLNEEVLQTWKLADGSYKLTNQLTGKSDFELVVKNRTAFINLEIQGLESYILKLE
jgi:glycosidase